MMGIKTFHMKKTGFDDDNSCAYKNLIQIGTQTFFAKKEKITFKSQRITIYLKQSLLFLSFCHFFTSPPNVTYYNLFETSLTLP